MQNQSVVVNNTETAVVTEQQSMSEGGNTPGVASNVGTASSTGTANAAGQTQTAGTVTEEASTAEPQTQETPAEEVPVVEPKTQETPVEEVPAVEPQTQETPAEVVPTAEPKEQETPVEEAPAAEPQTQETPVEETPVEETPAEEAPVEEKPTEETPAEEAPVQEVTPEEQAAADEEARLEEERKKAEEEFERAKKAWDALSQVMQTTVPKYRYDPEQVEEVSQMLSDGGWALNINGEPYDPTKDDVRCKEINGEIIPLDLTLAYPEGNAVAYQIESSLLNQLKDQGIKVTLVPVELNTLRDMLHRKIERNCDLIYISTNYDEVFDPSPSFDPADAEIGKTNLSGINDPILYELAKDMSKTEPGDNYTYATKWVKFQARYQQVVPAIPVYGNVYVDFFTSCLQNYDVSQNVTWTEAILYAYMSDPDMSEKPEEEEEPEFEDDGDFEIFD